jgi:phosphoglycolate phosphatase-like HAD superfamily hydrolase
MNSFNDIKAIFFDLDGTLRHSVPHGGDVFSDYAILTLGLRASEEDRLRAVTLGTSLLGKFADLREDLLAHSGETENFWIEYTRVDVSLLGRITGMGAD